MLRQPAADGRDAAVRWRQLVDLIARAGAAADPALLSDALDVIRTDMHRIEEPLRAAAARAIAALPLPLGLLQCFIADRLAVSAPILAAAKLDSGQWQVLLGGADAETRRFIETLHPDLILVEPAPLQPASGDLSIGELVTRIERRRMERAPRTATGDAVAVDPSLPDGRAGLFRWETAANGDIDWVDGVPRGAMIGRSLTKPAESASAATSDDIGRAMASRTPFRDKALTIAGDGPASGEWMFSGAPVFDPASGRFCGFHGLAERSRVVAVPAKAAPDLPAHLPLDGDSLRELVHELKTPLNAIIGFSEIIDGQFLGPAGRRYRSRANDIADEARLLLSAIDDLDLAAKLQAADPSQSAQGQLDGAVTYCLNAVRHLADQRGVAIAFAPPSQPVHVAVEPKLLNRLVTRLLRSVIDVAVNGEHIRVTVAQEARGTRLTLSRPVALSGPVTEQLAYEMRLARGLLRVVGGDARIDDKLVTADFPS